MLYRRYEDEVKEFTFRRDTDVGCTIHFHERVELLYFLGGEHEAIVNGEKRVLTADDICFCNSYDVHKMSPNNYGELYLFSFSLTAYDNFTKLYGNKLLPNFMTDKKENKKIFDILAQIEKIGKESNFLTKIGYMNLILGVLVDVYELKNPIKAISDIKDIIIFINENYYKNLDRDTVAGNFGYTPTYFSHFFKKNAGIGFKKYLDQVRIHNVAELVEKERLNKLQAATRCGFDNMTSYYRALKKQ